MDYNLIHKQSTRKQLYIYDPGNFLTTLSTFCKFVFYNLIKFLNEESLKVSSCTLELKLEYESVQE